MRYADPVPGDHDMANIQAAARTQHKAALLARQAELNQRLAEVEALLDTPPPADWEDMATAREDDAVLEATGLSGQHELRQIAAALVRLEAGTFGTCAVCGDAIGEDRLNALPYTPHCHTCAARKEITP
ncbi:MAG: TraR/DksA family transcriptional regulator [Paracoccaceae bacterium]